MRTVFDIGRKRFILKPYRTYQEKEILLTSEFGTGSLDETLRIVGFRSEYELDVIEKKLILYKYREISLGDEVNVKFRCSNCGMGVESTITAAGFFEPPQRTDADVKVIRGLEVTEETLQNFVNFNTEEIYLDEVEKLIERVKKNQFEVNFIKTCKCLNCKTPKFFDMSDEKYIVSIMSDDTLMTLYKRYHNLVYFGKHTMEGIDSMYPFERSIYEGLLNKTIEEINKK